MKVQHLRNQYPVGHGGFHSGEVRWWDDDREWPPLRYVYDCGAQKRWLAEEWVEQYLRLWCSDHKLDILFVSHLHADHVSGLPELLDSVQPRRVFLPYLSPLEKIVVVAASLAEEAPADLREIAIDPAGWFGERADEVYLVRSGGDGPGEFPLPTEGPLDFPPTRGEQGWDIKVPGARGGRENGEVEDVGKASQAEEISDKDPIIAGARAWVFLPYVAKPRVQELRKFSRRLKDTLRDLWDHRQDAHMSDALLDVMKSRSGQKGLAKCYRDVFGARGFNKTSLCIYSGPGFSSDWSYNWPGKGGLYSRLGFGEYVHSGRNCSWLGLGDAVLSTPEEVKRMATHYMNAPLPVWTLALPHHGSIDNYHPDLLSATSPASAYVACPEVSKRGKHPHPHVVEHVVANGCYLRIVNESSGGFLESFKTIDL